MTDQVYDIVIRRGLIVDGSGDEPFVGDVAVRGGGRRLIQLADGYDATIVSDEITYRAGQQTGALPGRLVRGAQRAPVAA